MHLTCEQLAPARMLIPTRSLPPSWGRVWGSWSWKQLVVFISLVVASWKRKTTRMDYLWMDTKAQNSSARNRSLKCIWAFESKLSYLGYCALVCVCLCLWCAVHCECSAPKCCPGCTSVCLYCDHHRNNSSISFTYYNKMVEKYNDVQ